MRRILSGCLAGLLLIAAVPATPALAAPPGSIMILEPSTPTWVKPGGNVSVRFHYTSEPSLPGSSQAVISLAPESGMPQGQVTMTAPVSDGTDLIYSTTLTVPASAPEERYSLQVEVRNSDGTNSAAVSQVVTVDGTPPTITALTAAPAVFGPQTRITATVQDNLDPSPSWVIEVFPGTGGQTPLVTFPGMGDVDRIFTGTDSGGQPLPDGTYRLRLTATDAAGNMNQQEITVQIDRTPPEILSLTASPSLFIPQKGTLRVTATLSKPASQELRIQPKGSAGVIRTIQVPTPGTAVRIDWDGRDDSGAPVADGDYLLTLMVTDDAGNTASASIEVRLENAAPLLSNVHITPNIIAPGVPGAVNSLRIEADSDRPGDFQIEILNGRGDTVTTITAAVGTSQLRYEFNGMVAGKPLPNGRYTARVTQIGGIHRSAPVDLAFTVDTRAPDPPKLTPLPAKIGQNRVTLSWAAHPGSDANGIAAYRVERLAGSGGTWTELATLAPSAREYRDSGLKAGTYRYRVVIIDRAGNTAVSEEVSTEVVTRIDPPTIGKIPEYTNQTRIRITWARSPSAEVEGYRIVRRVNGTPLQEMLVDKSVTEWVEENLLDLSRYEFAVIAFDALGNEAMSESLTVQTDRTPPDPFTMKELPAFVRGTVDLEWGTLHDQGSGIDRIEVLSSTDGIVFTTEATLPPESTRYTAYTGGSKRYFKIRAYDKAGNYTESSRMSASLDVTPPEVNLTVEPREFDQLRVLWDVRDDQELKSVQLQWRMGESGEWQDWLDEHGEPIRTASGVRDFQGRNHTTHYFRIIATDSAGNEARHEVQHHISFRRATVTERTNYYRGTGIYDVTLGTLPPGEVVVYLGDVTPYAKVRLASGDVVYVHRTKIQPEIEVRLHDKPIWFDVPPFIEGDRTLVPIRHIAEAVGATVTWDQATRTARISHGSRLIEIRIGERTALVDGTPVALDVPAQIRENRTFVPLRFVSESLGFVVTWDESTRTVHLK